MMRSVPTTRLGWMDMHLTRVSLRQPPRQRDRGGTPGPPPFRSQRSGGGPTAHTHARWATGRDTPFSGWRVSGLQGAKVRGRTYADRYHAKRVLLDVQRVRRDPHQHLSHPDGLIERFTGR
jgi:hypothetical protein